jgi:hypothetical protein
MHPNHTVNYTPGRIGSVPRPQIDLELAGSAPNVLRDACHQCIRTLDYCPSKYFQQDPCTPFRSRWRGIYDESSPERHSIKEPLVCKLLANEKHALVLDWFLWLDLYVKSVLNYIAYHEAGRSLSGPQMPKGVRNPSRLPDCQFISVFSSILGRLALSSWKAMSILPASAAGKLNGSQHSSRQ